MVAEMDAMLTDINVSLKQIAAMKEDLLRFVAVDLAGVFTNIYDVRQKHWGENLATISAIDDDLPTVRGTDLTWMSEVEIDLFDNFRLSDELDAHLAGLLPEKTGPADDVQKLKMLAAEIGELYRDSRKEGNISLSAARFLERYAQPLHGWEAKYREMFNIDP